METIIIHAEPEKIKALKAFLKAFHIPFEIEKGEKPYNPEFVKMVREADGRADYKEVDTDDLWGSIGLK